MTNSHRYRSEAAPNPSHPENPTRSWLRLVSRDIVRRLIDARRGLSRKNPEVKSTEDETKPGKDNVQKRAVG